MANHRDRDPDRDRDFNQGRERNGDRDTPRGMFGYEGEGYMRGGNDYDDFARSGYGRDQEGDFRSGFSGGYGTDAGYRGGGNLGGDWLGGSRVPPPLRHQSGPMWGPPDRDYVSRPADAISAERGW